MTATDELRRLLDERGEYYKVSGNRTWWGRPIDARTGEPINVFHNQAQPMGEDRLFVELQLATPAQAVEATLGRGECTVVSKLLIEGEYVPSSYYEFEMECGEGFKWDESIPPRCCPNCGRKVVDA